MTENVIDYRDESFNLSSIYQSLGICWFNIGQVIKAIEETKKGIEINPFKLELYKNLISFYPQSSGLELENYLKSRLSKLYNQNVPIELPSVIFQAFGCFYKKFNYDTEAVIAEYRIAFNFNPNDFIVSYELGYLYLEWETLKKTNSDVIDFLFQHDNNIEQYIGDQIFNLRKDLTKYFFTNSFSSYYSLVKDSLIEKSSYTLYQFCSSSKYCLDILDNKRLTFINPKKWKDEFDCPLIYQSENKAKISYDFVRARCLANLDILEGGINNINNISTLLEKNLDGSNGVIYKLKIAKDWLLEYNIYINDVVYKEDIQKIKYKFDGPEDIIYNGIYTKQKGNGFEAETRMLIFNDFSNIDIIYAPFNSLVEIEAIYLSSKLDVEIESDTILKAKRNRIPVFKMDRNFGEFKIQEV